MENNNNKRVFSKLMIGIRIYVAVIVLFIVAAVALRYYKLAIVECAVLAVLSVYYFSNKKMQQQHLLQYIENLTFHLDNATKDSMIHSPLPMTVLDLTGNIVWYNQKFGDIAGSNVFDKPISEVVPSVHILNILEDKDNIRLDVDYQGRHFELVGNVMEYTGEKQDTSYSIVLYWIDRSEECRWRRQFLDVRTVSCILLIDNYDELINNTPDGSITALTALIDQKITGWAAKAGGIVRKTDKDRYSLLFEYASLLKLIEQKFDVLDAVHEINVGNRIPVTLSIGVGQGDTLQQSDEYARASIDMALGRGGDQAVIKDVEQFRFFGGRSEGVEKSTRVKARVIASALRELIDQSAQVFITGHRYADADSFGAAVGICKMAKSRQAECYVVVNDMTDTTAKMWRTFEQDEVYRDTFITENQALQLLEPGSLLIVVDTHKPSYVDGARLLEQADNVVLIDHHRRSTEFIQNAVLTYHEPYASSTSEMVTEMLQYMDDNFRLTPHEAQALFAGMVLDTKNFSVKTGVRTFEAASYLRRMGVDTVSVKRLFQNDLSQYVKRARIVSKAEIYKNTIAISSWEEVDPQAQVVASQAADELLNISEVNASFVLCKSTDGIAISGRSLGSYNVQVVLERLGGGGHMTVAGAQLKGKGIHEGMELLKQAIDAADQ